MKITKRTDSTERQILTGMIVDKVVLGRIVAKWQEGMFRSRWSNIVAGWCVRYFEKYKKAPKAKIEPLFEHWASRTKDKSVINLVEGFIASLSEEYKTSAKELNSDYVIDLAGHYFNKVRVERLIDEIQNDIDNNKVEAAHEKVTSFSKVEMGVGEGVDIFKDQQAVIDAFSKDDREVLIEYPGALGEFFGRELSRDALIAFVGPDKVGKSFWLQDVAFRALLLRHRVAYFEAGDNSKNQVIRRFMSRASHRAIWADKRVKIPISIRRKKKTPFAIVRVKKRRFKKNLSAKVSLRACRVFMEHQVKTKKSLFKLSCHDNDTLNIKTIQSILQDWERTGWVPDVVIIDYADIMDMTYYNLEGRDRINKTWKQLRSLSQKYHCLVATASQTDTDAYTTKVIRKKNFSDDKRKLAHVTGMVGLNVTDDEKDMGITRLNWVVLRGTKYSEYRCVHVAGCLGIGNPAIKSCW